MKLLPKPSLNGFDITLVSFWLVEKLVPPLLEKVANES